MNYLKATGLEAGLLVNFGAEALRWEHKVLTAPSLYPKNPRHPRSIQESV
jgi:hypothetical protein